MSALRAALDLFLDPLQQLADRAAMVAPRALAALILIAVGFVLARALSVVLLDLAAKLRVDDRSGGLGLDRALSRLGLGRSPSALIAELASWGVLLAFFVQAGRTLDLAYVSGLLDRLVAFLGSLAVAAAILLAGLAFARLAARVVAGAAEANAVPCGARLSKAAAVAVLVYFGWLASEELGAPASLTVDALKIVLASLGLAFAVAFGLAGKDAAAELLRGLRKDEKA